MIKKNTLLLIFLYASLFFCFEPKLFVKYQIFNIIYIGGILFSFLVILYIYFKEKMPIPKSFLYILVFRLSFMIQTILSKGDITMWGYFSIVLFVLSLVINYFSRKNVRVLLSAICNVLLSLLVVNLGVILLFPEGIINEIYFIGIRTRFTDVIFPCLIICMVTDRVNNKTISVRTALCIAVSLYTMLAVAIVTALIGSIMLILFYFVCRLIKNRQFNWLIFICIFALVLNMLVVDLSIIDRFEWLISGVFGKQMTLSGRTEIWELGKEIVKRKLIFGYGMYDNGNFIYWGYTGSVFGYWQAHNQWLQLVHDGGIISLFTFILFIVKSNVGFTKINDNRIRAMLLACLVAFMIMMVSEIYSYTPYFFVLLLIMYQGEFLNVEEKYEENRISSCL